MPAAAGAATDDEMPGTTSNSTPAEASASVDVVPAVMRADLPVRQCDRWSERSSRPGGDLLAEPLDPAFRVHLVATIPILAESLR